MASEDQKSRAAATVLGSLMLSTAIITGARILSAGGMWANIIASVAFIFIVAVTVEFLKAVR